MFQQSSHSKRPKLSASSSLFREAPPHTVVEERHDSAVVSSTGGHPFRKTAYFLRPTSSIDEHQPRFKVPRDFSSLPTRFEPKKLPLKLDFRAWRFDHGELQAWVAHLAPTHQSTWRKAGIYEAIMSSTYEITRNKKDFVCGFTEKWCCETNTFVFPWGEATITLEDVMVLGGFSVVGDSVFSSLQTKDERQIEEKLNEERRGLFSSAAGALRIGCTKLWLKQFMKSGSELEHEAFLVFWLSRYVFNHFNLVNKAVIPIAIRLARGVRISLAPAVLACIYRDLTLLKATLVSDELKTCVDVFKLCLQSPFQLVQVWGWERFLELRPKPKAIGFGEPRLARWDRVDGPSVGNLRRVLDLAGEDFMWRPYAMVIENWSNPKYYSDKAMWVCPGSDHELLSFAICLRVSELEGFGVREQYHPHRVARQFGFDQDIPCSRVASSDKNSDMLGEKYHTRELRNVKLYVPSRLSEADMSTRYMNWWIETVSGLKHTTTEPRKRNWFDELNISETPVHVSKGSNGDNDSHVPPGFPPKSKGMAGGACIDEDELTVSESLNNHIKLETEEGCYREKLSVDVQNFASSVSFQGSVNLMESENFEKEIKLSEALVGGSNSKLIPETVKRCNASSQDKDTVSNTASNCSCSNTLVEILSTLKEFSKEFSELKAKVSWLENVVDVSQAKSNGAGSRKR